jgi:hypothetical protein
MKSVSRIHCQAGHARALNGVSECGTQTAASPSNSGCAILTVGANHCPTKRPEALGWALAWDAYSEHNLTCLMHPPRLPSPSSDHDVAKHIQAMNSRYTCMQHCVAHRGPAAAACLPLAKIAKNCFPSSASPCAPLPRLPPPSHSSAFPTLLAPPCLTLPQPQP